MGDTDGTRSDQYILCLRRYCRRMGIGILKLKPFSCNHTQNTQILEHHLVLYRKYLHSQYYKTFKNNKWKLRPLEVSKKACFLQTNKQSQSRLSSHKPKSLQLLKFRICKDQIQFSNRNLSAFFFPSVKLGKKHSHTFCFPETSWSSVVCDVQA